MQNNNQDYAHYKGHPEPDTDPHQLPTHLRAPKPQQTTAKPASRRRTAFMLMSLLGVVLVGGLIGYLGMQYFRDTTPEPVAEAPKTEPKPTAKSVSSFDIFLKEMQSAIGAERIQRNLASGYVENIEPYPYSTQLENIPGFVMEIKSSEVNSIHAKAADQLQKYGSDVTTYANMSAEVQQFGVYFCTWLTTPGSTAELTRVEITCGEQADFAALALRQYPLFVVARQARVFPEETIDTVVLRGYNQSPSKSTGYATARMGLATNNEGVFTHENDLLFYRTPNETWHFFKKARAGSVPCAEYTTTDQKLAYIDQPCTLPNGTATKVAP